MDQLQQLQQEYKKLKEWCEELEALVYPDSDLVVLEPGRDYVREALETCWSREPDSYILGNITAGELEVLLRKLK